MAVSAILILTMGQAGAAGAAGNMTAGDEKKFFRWPGFYRGSSGFAEPEGKSLILGHGIVEMTGTRERSGAIGLDLKTARRP